MRSLALVTMTLLLALASAPASSGPAASPPSAPSAALDPNETVQAMLAAMRKNSDAGIEELYRFSSPGNREKTGSVTRFKQMMHDYFPDLLGNRSARLAPALVDGPKAMIGAEVLGSDGEPHRYVFLLSLQKGAPCDGCWMADAVFSPEQEEEGDGPGNPDGPDAPPPMPRNDTPT